MRMRKRLYRNRAGFARATCVALVAALFWGAPAAAQRGSTKKAKSPRAVAVLRFVTDAKGRATPQLLPVSLLIEGKFYDAGQYGAAPIPLALTPGNVYEAQEHGQLLGTFTVQGSRKKGEQAAEQWIGTGTFQSETAPFFATAPSGPLSSAAAGTAGPGDVPEGELHRKSRTVYDEQGRPVKTDSGKNSDDSDEPPTLKRGKPETIERQPQISKSKPQTSPSTSGATTSGQTNPDDDPDRPRLKRGAPPSPTTSGSSTTTETTAQTAQAQSQAQPPMPDAAAIPANPNPESSDSTITPETPDPDRPRLKRGKPAAATATAGSSASATSASATSSSATSAAAQANGAGATAPPEKSAPYPYPAGPTMASAEYASANDQVPIRVRERGAKPLGVGRVYEVVAVSDADLSLVPQDYNFRATEEERQAFRQKMERMADGEIRGSAGRLSPATISKAGRVKASAKSPAKTPAKIKTTADYSFSFSEEQLAILDVDYNNSAELVFTGTREAGGGPVYVTVVARVDVMGNLRKLFSRVTTPERMDTAPRLEFIDAVDAEGDGTAELLFRAYGAGGERAFVLYKAGADGLSTLFQAGEGRAPER